MSALQSDLFGLMGEGNIQSCGSEICLISAEWMQFVSQPERRNTQQHHNNHVDATNVVSCKISSSYEKYIAVKYKHHVNVFISIIQNKDDTKSFPVQNNYCWYCEQGLNSRLAANTKLIYSSKF